LLYTYRCGIDLDEKSQYAVKIKYKEFLRGFKHEK